MESSNMDKINLLNKYFKKYDGKAISCQVCEICLETNNLLICDNCKNYYHLKCIEIKVIPLKFYCSDCKEIFNLNDNKIFEISSIFDMKTSNSNKNTNQELKQRSYKKESFTSVNKKTKRELSQSSFNQSFYFKENDRDAEKNYETMYFPNKEKVIKLIFYSIF